MIAIELRRSRFRMSPSIYSLDRPGSGTMIILPIGTHICSSAGVYMKVGIMQAKSPLFSIVIPTRNRSHLLVGALKSALEQDYDDYEVVIVANNCQDNTREVVERLQTERVKYYETDRTLPMPANWELAWTKASGQYVTYLADDDALVSTALSFLAQNTLEDKPPVVSWEDAIYYYPNWNDKKTQNVLLLFFYGDAVIEDVPSEVYRKQCAQFSFAWSAPIPKLYNCVVNREFFEAWRVKLGLLFFPVAPDYSFAWIATHDHCPGTAYYVVNRRFAATAHL